RPVARRDPGRARRRRQRRLEADRPATPRPTRRRARPTPVLAGAARRRAAVPVRSSPRRVRGHEPRDRPAPRPDRRTTDSTSAGGRPLNLEWEQVVVDAGDPLALGRWWAEALRW